MENGNNWLSGGDSVRELRSYYHFCHSLVKPYHFCQQSEVLSFLPFCQSEESECIHFTFTDSSRSSEWQDKRRAKGKQKDAELLKKGAEVFKKSAELLNKHAELFLKPQGLLATSGVGCIANANIHIVNANIHIVNANIRIGQRVYSH